MAKLLNRAATLFLVLVTLTLSAAIPSLDGGEFLGPTRVKAPHTTTPTAGHDHAICIVFSANPGLPTVARTPDLGKPWEPFSPPATPYLSSTPSLSSHYHPRAPPLV